MDARVLLVPGLWNSGPENWQSHWEREHGYLRVRQRDWDKPVCSEWIETLDAAVMQDPARTILAAHSLGCATVAHWAARYGRTIRGALLVAPSDAEAPNYPEGTTGFTPLALARLPFPSLVVASADDIYVSLERAKHFAEAWGSALINIGPAGHINADSGHGPWPEGHELLKTLMG